MDWSDIEVRKKLCRGLCATKRLQKIASWPTLADSNSDIVNIFIKRSWRCVVHKEKLLTLGRKVYGVTGRLITNEQGATSQQILANFFLCALADIAHAWIDESEDALLSPCEFALEQLKFVATQRILSPIKQAIVLSEEQIASIEQSDEVVAEIEKQKSELNALNNLVEIDSETIRVLRMRA